jgi:hypothetical protein
MYITLAHHTNVPSCPLFVLPLFAWDTRSNLDTSQPLILTLFSNAGKAVVHTAGGGVPPRLILPVTLDVGCETPAVRDDPLYLGLCQRRLRGPAYDDLVDELIVALRRRYGPSLLIHWEDFSSRNSFRLLAKYRAQVTRPGVVWKVCFPIAIIVIITATRRHDIYNYVVVVMAQRLAGLTSNDMVVSVNITLIRSGE